MKAEHIQQSVTRPRRRVTHTRDTSPDAANAQTEALRRLGPSRRFLVACDMCDTVRDLARARIAQQHPDFDDRAIHDQLIWELYGVRPER